jgi:hypothetical protein
MEEVSFCGAGTLKWGDQLLRFMFVAAAVNVAARARGEVDEEKD